MRATTSVQRQASSSTQAVNVAGDLSHELASLPKAPGAADMMAAPGGLAAHGPYRAADVKYPGNQGATNLLSTTQVLKKLHLAPGFTNASTASLTVQSISLKRFADTDVMATGKFKVLTTADDRQVYEIRTEFAGPYSHRGNTFGSGARVFIVDAASGDPLYTVIHAPLLQSGHLHVVHHMRPAPQSAIIAPMQTAPITSAATTAPKY
jgi:hypothetical protein